ncbi:MAG TPA: helicase SNF2 [Variovorax sp.]
MNTTTKILAAAALSALAVVGAQAETYDGVHPLVSGNSRADVHAQAVVASHHVNPYGDLYGEGVATIAGNIDRASVHSQAVAAAHSPNPYADGYGEGVMSIAGTVDRNSVRAAARAAARGDQLPL